MQERLQYLFGRYLDNSCSREEMEEFFQYLQRADHDLELRRLIRQVYTAICEDPGYSSCVNESGQLVLNEPDWLRTPMLVVEKPSRQWRVPVLAAVLVLLGTIITWKAIDSHSEQKDNRLTSLTKKETDRSEYKYLLLEDSTQVWLNVASSLEFPEHFKDDKREVYLQGEAYFDVKHADKIPFVIHTRNISTTVLGTAFNVKAYPGEKDVIVSVSRGKVEVRRGPGLVATVENGEQVKVEDRGTEVTERKVLPAKIAAWQQGNIAYDDERFVDIIADLERTYNVTIEMTDKEMEEMKISTSFKKNIGIGQALQVLCRLTDSRLRTEDGNYIID